MRTAYYTSFDERKTLLDEAKTRGERCLHDDFLDANGAQTDGKSGRLSFEVPAPESLAVRKLNASRKRAAIVKTALKQGNPDVSDSDVTDQGLAAMIEIIDPVIVRMELLGVTFPAQAKALFNAAKAALASAKTTNPDPTE